MLSAIARLLDPLGWINPIIVLAKIIMKRLWQHQLEWDDPLPEKLANEWTQYIENLKEIRSIKIPRWIETSDQNQT